MIRTNASGGRARRWIGTAARRFGLWFLLVPPAVFLVVPPSATAANRCTTHEVLVEKLGTDYEETVIARGLANSGVMVEVFSDSDGSTWTIIITQPSGASCIVAAGEAWTEVEKLILGSRI